MATFEKIAHKAKRRAAMFALTCALILLCAGNAWGQGAQFSDDVLRTNSVISGASVRVCTSAGTGTPCTPLATIYSDRALTSAISGSIVTADSSGRFRFYAAPGCYYVQISAAGFSTYSYTFCQGSGGALDADNAWTGNNTHAGTETFNGNLDATSGGALNGNFTFGGTNTHNGAETFTAGLLDGDLTPGNCVQATTLGLLTTTSGPCGTSSGTLILA
jgi:hypothetical protein